MNKRIGNARAIFLLCVVCLPVTAQTCRDDIPATAPDSRFIDNNDGTVTDVATRLMWKQCVEGLSGVGCVDGSFDFYSWQDAFQLAAGADFRGYTDWRVPNKNEFESLVELRCYDPSINGTYFPNTPSAPALTSSTAAPAANYAWRVYFPNGVVDPYTPKSSGSGGTVRLVRNVQ